jgi:hypothetical protein
MLVQMSNLVFSAKVGTLVGTLVGTFKRPTRTEKPPNWGVNVPTVPTNFSLIYGSEEALSFAGEGKDGEKSGNVTLLDDRFYRLYLIYLTFPLTFPLAFPLRSHFAPWLGDNSLGKELFCLFAGVGTLKDRDAFVNISNLIAQGVEL